MLYLADLFLFLQQYFVQMTSFSSGQSVLNVEASHLARREPHILKNCLKPLHMCVTFIYS